MEETNNQSIRERLIKLMPLVFSLFVILLIGLSFIGPFFELRLKDNGEKIDTIYTLSELMFTNPTSVNSQVFFILCYLGLPLLGCLFLYLSRFHKNFLLVSVLLFLLVATASILSKDVVATSLCETTGLNYSIHNVYFCYILPIVTFFIAALVALVIASNKISISVADMTEIGVLIGLALVLNFVKFVQLGETGGSINFQILPLFILALRKGPIKGFIGAGIAYGLISCLTDGYGIATFPFDYLIGMGSTCILGFFSPYIFGKDQNTYNLKGEIFLFIGATLATFFRFVGSTASSMIIYGYDLVPAMAYNAVYVSVSGAIAIALIMAIYGPFIKINKRFPIDKIKSTM